MHITLFEYRELEDRFVQGDFLGDVRLVEGAAIIAVENRDIKERLEKFFSEPFTYYDGDHSGVTLSTTKQVAKPHTEEFFRAAVYALEKMAIKAVLEE